MGMRVPDYIPDSIAKAPETTPDPENFFKKSGSGFFNKSSVPATPPAEEPSGIAKILGKLNPAGLAYDAIKDSVSGFAQSGQFGASDTVSKPTFDTTQDQTKVTKTGLPGAASTAQQGIERAASTEQNLLAPAAKTTSTETGLTSKENLANVYRIQSDLDTFRKSQDMAQAKLSQVYENAKVDPRQFVGQMGVGDKTMAAIGLVLSGMGSGLTGQPNMAMNMLQKQIDQNIESQRKNIETQIYAATQQAGVAAQDLNAAQIRAAAQSLASQTVAQGANAFIESTKNQITGQTAKDRADALTYKLQQDLLNSQAVYDNLVKGMATSGDTKTLNAIGQLLHNYGVIGPNGDQSKVQTGVRAPRETLPLSQVIKGSPPPPFEGKAPDLSNLPKAKLTDQGSKSLFDAIRSSQLENPYSGTFK